MVSNNVATATNGSPPIFSAIMVTSAAAVKLTKLTPRQIKPINFSGSFKSFSSIFADLLPFLT